VRHDALDGDESCRTGDAAVAHANDAGIYVRATVLKLR
jgi:hypothetical protein